MMRSFIQRTRVADGREHKHMRCQKRSVVEVPNFEMVPKKDEEEKKRRKINRLEKRWVADPGNVYVLEEIKGKRPETQKFRHRNQIRPSQRPGISGACCHRSKDNTE
jgi:hypothetical protein